MSYKLVRDIDGTENTTLIKRISDGAFIPFSEGNADYQEYLSWVEEGNTPEPADPVEE